jgi:hypothetical protein
MGKNLPISEPENGKDFSHFSWSLEGAEKFFNLLIERLNSAFQGAVNQEMGRNLPNLDTSLILKDLILKDAPIPMSHDRPENLCYISV